MGVIIPVGYAQCNMVFQCAGRPTTNIWTLGIHNKAVGSASDIALYVRTSFTGSGKPYAASTIGSSWSFLGVDCTLVDETGTHLGQSRSTVTGTFSSAQLPINCAVLMRKSSSLGGRKNRGRAYLPPVYPGEGNVDAAGVIDSGFVTSLQALYTAAHSAFDTDDYEPVVLHSTGDTPAPITSFDIQSILATQRRRMR